MFINRMNLTANPTSQLIRREVRVKEELLRLLAYRHLASFTLEPNLQHFEDVKV